MVGMTRDMTDDKIRSRIEALFVVVIMIPRVFLKQYERYISDDYCTYLKTRYNFPISLSPISQYQLKAIIPFSFDMEH